MAIPSRQIGQSAEANLLWNISKQFEQLINVSSTLVSSTPNLQQVTDIGALTTNAISVVNTTPNSLNFYGQVVAGGTGLYLRLDDGYTKGIQILNNDTSGTFPFTFSQYDGDVTTTLLTDINDLGELTAPKLIKRGGTSAQILLANGDIITNNSTNWNTAYTDRNKWDGGLTGLVSNTGRISLGLDKLTNLLNADYVIIPTDKTIATSVAFTAPRTVTLPLASTVNYGYEIIIDDLIGTVTSTNTLTIIRASTDTVNGTTSVVIAAAFGARRLISNGIDKWSFDGGVLRASNNLSDIASPSTALTNLGGQSKLLSANTIMANNTAASANAQTFVFKNPGQQVYTGTPVWTGTTAPSGTTNHTYNWSQIGNLVTLKITILYSVAGSALTSVFLPIPTDAPTPLKPSGFTTASNFLYSANGFALGSLTSAPASGARLYMRSNSANNGFEIGGSLPSGAHTAFDIIVQYFTS